MDGYLDALEATDDTLREEALQRHARQVRTHIQQLASKNYTAQFAHAPEFTVLFLPSESFFSAALQSDPGLIERGVDQGVILATPTTLIALLRAVAYGWRQEAIAENAREICALGRTLHERLGKLADHFAKLGRSLGNAVENYNNAIGSFETRVLTTARKFEDLKAAPEAATIANLETIDHIPRHLQSIGSGILPAPLDEPPAEASPVPNMDDDFSFVPGDAGILPASSSPPGDTGVATDSPPPPAPDDADFSFVPEPPASARNAAADLRSALE